ncbi:MAG: glutathione S-transferase family protein [bacterium]
MIFIGQYDSPFVRRVAIAMRRYGLAWEHRPWSVGGNAEEIAAFNPLRRVPVLVLDSGECLVESSAILDYLDELVGPERALLPRSGPARRAGLRVCALATGLADKAVSLVYERALRAGHESPVWVARCKTQIEGALAFLEKERAASPGEWWLKEGFSHADIAVGCALTFLAQAHPDLFVADQRPALAAHVQRCEALAEFREINQPLIVSMKK